MIQAFSTSRFVAPKSTMISPQESPSLIIRGPRPADERDWRRLWFGYCSFYDTAVPEDVTAATWDRMLAAGSPLFSASPTGTAKSQASPFRFFTRTHAPLLCGAAQKKRRQAHIRWTGGKFSFLIV
jgi:hypothetical protein